MQNNIPVTLTHNDLHKGNWFKLDAELGMSAGRLSGREVTGFIQVCKTSSAALVVTGVAI